MSVAILAQGTSILGPSFSKSLGHRRMTKRKAPSIGPHGRPRKKACFSGDQEAKESESSVSSKTPYPEGFPLQAPKSDDLNALIQLEFKGRVHLVNAAQEDVDWSRLESAPVLGMDTETKPVFEKGVWPNPTALVQLATKDECWIFQLLPPFGVSKRTQDRLQAVLESPKQVKVGVGILEDFRDLSDSHFPSLRSADAVIDLQDIVKPYGLKQTNLRALVAIFLCRRLAKSQQTSNWGSAKLSPGQIWYAAADAWAALQLLEKLRNLFSGSEAWAPAKRVVITDD